MKEAPLSFGQRGLWLLQQVLPDSAAYNFVSATRLAHRVDTDALARAFYRVAERHEILRTTFHLSAGQAVQRIHPTPSVDIDVVPSTLLSPEDLQAALGAEVLRPFDLQRGPLWRVRLYERGPDDWVMFLNFHHIITDLWSVALLAHELNACYGAEITGEPDGLRPVRQQFAEFVGEERRYFESAQAEDDWAYWRSRLASLPPQLSLPTDRPRPTQASARGISVSTTMPVALTAALTRIAEEAGTNLHALTMAVSQVLFSRYSGQRDIVSVTPKARRTRRNFLTFGYFINPVAIRSDLAGRPAFTTFLEQFGRDAREALERGSFPFEEVVDRLHLPSEPGRSALMQTAMGWQKTSKMAGDEFSALALNRDGGTARHAHLAYESMHLETRVVPADMLVNFGEGNGALTATFECSADLFDRATVVRMLGHVRRLLEGVAASPSAPIDELPLLGDEERHRVVVEWNRSTPVDQPAATAHGMFERSARHEPSAVAVRSPAGPMTYGELDARATRLAQVLLARGLGRGEIVALACDRSSEHVEALLATLKAGAVFLPLDLSDPIERLTFMLQDAGVRLILATSRVAARVPSAGIEMLCVDEIERDEVPETAAVALPAVDADAPAYVIYTSGSTGRPKGTLLRHGGLAAIIYALVARLGLERTDRVLQFATPSFDASVMDTFTAFASGATLCLAPASRLGALDGLAEVCREEGVTAALLPPSLLAVLDPARFPGLRILIAGGERCTRELVRKWSAGRRFVNAYGPTEATIVGTVEICDGDHGRDPAIGRPLAGATCFVLDETGRPAPIGVAGELCIGGAGVGFGYLGRLDLTAERFVPDPFGEVPGGRLYRTGDLARFLNDGRLEYLGRLDHQVKVRGFRIELAEVESALAAVAAVRRVAVVARTSVAGDTRLVAYIELQDGAAMTAAELQSAAGRVLPRYMVPDVVMMIPALPLTASGKVDRRALPPPSQVRENAGVHVSPQTDTQRRVAAVWEEVLQVPHVGLDDNFFELGGHSLSMVKAHQRLETVFDRKIPMIELFRAPTVRALAAHLTGGDEQSTAARSYRRAEQQRAALGRLRERSRVERK